MTEKEPVALAMNRRKLLKSLSEGHLKNIAFADFTNLVEGFGFSLLRTRGSHHIYGHPGISELVNLQDVRGQVKPYQARQFLKLVERYNISLELDNE